MYVLTAKRFLSLLMAGSLTALSLSACSSSGSSGNGGTPVTLSEVAHSIFYAPQYAAIELGYFEEEGINLTLVNAGGADKVMTSLISGDAQIGFMGSEASIYVYQEGSEDPAVNFAQLTQRAGNFLVGRQAEENFDWASLKGRKVLGGRAARRRMKRGHTLKASMDLPLYEIYFIVTAKKRLSDAFQYHFNLSLYANRPFHDLMGCKCFIHIYAYVGCQIILSRVFPKRIFNDSRRILSYAQFPKQHTNSLMAAYEILIAPGRSVPALILNKPMITAQIHRHWRLADRTMGNHLCRHSHIPLHCCHTAYSFFIVIGFLMTGPAALPQPIISLSAEQTLFIKACHLKLMVYIGGKNKIVLFLHQFQQFIINRLWRFFITV